MQTFNADDEAKNILLTNTIIQEQIITLFGNQIISNNELDLLKLSEYVFLNQKYQNSLNKIIWPEVFNKIVSDYKKCNNKKTVFIVDAALLLEAGYKDFFDTILLITSKKSLRIQRIIRRNNIPNNQIKKRMAMQMPEKTKIKLINNVIYNNGSLNSLYNKLENFYSDFILKHHKNTSLL